MSAESPTLLITGGSGFLGTAILRELLDKNPVLSFERILVFDLNEPRVKDDRLTFIRGDIRDKESISGAAKEADIIIHSAAIVDWGTKPEEEILQVNVQGTANVINACRENNIRFLVYTSSLDAIFGGKPLVDIDETIPWPEIQPNSYCKSKQLSEKLVAGAFREGLKTIVLRPSDIYGEGDPFHVGSLISMAKGGFYVRLGDCTSRSQHVYVGNMAHAHLLAAKALLDGSDHVAGNTYFITDGPATNFFTFFDRIVEEAGYKIWPKKFNIPRNLAYFIGSVSEGFAFILRPVRKYTPKFSRFAVIYTCSDFTFKTEKARLELGFVPKYSHEEAFQRTVAYFRKK